MQIQKQTNSPTFIKSRKFHCNSSVHGQCEGVEIAKHLALAPQVFFSLNRMIASIQDVGGDVGHKQGTTWGVTVSHPLSIHL
jgi:hypothetical protein